MNLSELPTRIVMKIDPQDEGVHRGCWLWTGSLRQGYGQLWDRETGRSRGAHRAIYERLVGAVPPGLQLDHLCRVRSCVNPLHLEPVTAKENLRRSPYVGRSGQSAGRINALKTHCPQGHAFAGDNLYVRTNGSRACRACVAASLQRHYARKRGTP